VQQEILRQLVLHKEMLGHQETVLLLMEVEEVEELLLEEVVQLQV
jgi:hypothetical protein